MLKSKCKKIVDEWIINAADLFDKLIIENTIPLNDMPPDQLSIILSSIDI